MEPGKSSPPSSRKSPARPATPSSDIDYLDEEPAAGARSAALQNLVSLARRVVATHATILILGESGTGKSMLARALHHRSLRRDGPFITVNCPCLQAQLLESELFGHVRGSFTGAVNDTLGKVAAAEGGTLFLDELGELPREVQPKLLRLLQDGCYERVGETVTRTANIRIIAATNRDLKAEVSAGRFREDLYYRLNVISLELPPLRARPEDILTSADRFLGEINGTLGRTRRLTDAARLELQRHSWPGNLRELRNVIERAAILCDGDQIDASDLPGLGDDSDKWTPQVGDFVTLETLQDAHMKKILARTQTYRQAADVLGIDKATLYRRLKRIEHRVTSFAIGDGMAQAG